MFFNIGQYLHKPKEYVHTLHEYMYIFKVHLDQTLHLKKTTLYKNARPLVRSMLKSKKVPIFMYGLYMTVKPSV